MLLWHSTSDQSDKLLRFSSIECRRAGPAQAEPSDTAADEEKSYPLIDLSLTRVPIILRIHEPLVWRLAAFAERLRSPHAGGSASAAVVRADPVVTIGVLSLSTAACRLSFKGEPASRPLHGLGGSLITFANLDGAPIAVQELRHEALRIRRGAIAPMLLKSVSRQITMQGMRLLTGVDILADANDALSTLSSSLASITGDAHFQERSSARRGREETSMAGALIHGGEALGAGLFRGVTGLATKPLEGARDKGLSGFLTGIGRGVAGLVLQPMSGAVDLASKAVEGVNASKASMLDAVRESAGSTRRRPPLAVGAHGAVRRFDRHAAEGQAMLRLAEWRAVGSTGGVVDRLDIFKTRAKYARDVYVAHEELPDGRVAVVSNARVLLLEKPTPSTDVLTERCSIVWALDLADILSAEGAEPMAVATRGTGGCSVPLPSVVVLHLRTRTKDRLLGSVVDRRTIACTPRTEQAQRLLSVVQGGLTQLSEALACSRG